MRSWPLRRHFNGTVRLFSSPKSERGERRRKVRRDRKHLEARSRRFLKIYLSADETRKPHFYEVLHDASLKCFPTQSGLPSPDLEDADIAEATSDAAMKVVLERGILKNGDSTADFITDAYATVGVAYHRAAGLYVLDNTCRSWGLRLFTFSQSRRHI